MHFCNNVIANRSILCRALASVTNVLKACWSLVKVVVLFFSFGFVLAIVIIVLVVGKKRERR